MLHSEESKCDFKHFINVVILVICIYAIHKPRSMLRDMNQTFIPSTLSKH